MHPQIVDLKNNIHNTRVQLLKHPVYENIKDLSGLQNFAQFHVFAVWDFMSLLKSLQINLTSVNLPWMPIGSANTRYLINEIVLGEESDIDQEGNRVSHFELYLQAMRQMEANTDLIDALLNSLSSGVEINNAIQAANIPVQVKDFLNFTFDVAKNAPLHVKAAVFTFGREDLIPDMFTQILNEVHAKFPDKVSMFKYYIERHIEVDGEHHSQLAIEMVAELCGNDDVKWEEATKAAVKSLEMRVKLWDAIMVG
jgi:hypothetical protein